MKKTIAEHARDVLLEQNLFEICAIEVDICHEAYRRSGGRVSHPYDRIRAVIQGVRDSELFVPDGYIRACDNSGEREINHPNFRLVEAGARA
ncbi:hypothetical protein HNP46_006318 [Pseudomonas nitritireducens]|uniref:Uncharacterized protein n=1 Tax=Pseudomonas nitroreducens TaxID=46680 RepID=A0A7W7KRU4_PSENT|nr:hypothetical protein [Pseudomonas nitritireducens]MBB4867405.1 hypothetical protein [Pseudomonas nitritireducens]